MQGIAEAAGRLKRGYRTLVEHRYTTIAGTLVFFLVTSIVPFLFWLTLLFGKTGITGEEILELEIFGWAKELLIFLRTNAEGATRGAGVLFLGTTLWSSTGFFYHLRRSGEIIYEYNRTKQGFKVRIAALALTFAVLLYFAAGGAALVAGVLASRYLPPWIGYPAVYLLLLAFFFFAAWILNLYVCPYRIGPSDTAIGSALTAVLWLLASAAFALYLNFGSRERLYGALSLVIVFLLYLYWMMVCFTVGAIYNHVRLGNRRLPHKKL